MTISRIFARANHDVLRTLVGFRDDTGAFVHTGLRRQSAPGGRRYLVESEAHQRIDHLASLLDALPASEDLPSWLSAAGLGDHTLQVQSSTRILTSEYDVLILSLQAEVEHELWRQRTTGRLFYAGSTRWRRRSWTPAEQQQLLTDFEAEPLTPERWAEGFARVLWRLRQRSRCPIVIFLGEVPRLRPLQFDFSLDSSDVSYDPAWLRNLRFQEAAIELARSSDSLFLMNGAAMLCGLGIDRCVTAPFRYTADVYPMFTDELARILEEVL